MLSLVDMVVCYSYRPQLFCLHQQQNRNNYIKHNIVRRILMNNRNLIVIINTGKIILISFFISPNKLSDNLSLTQWIDHVNWSKFSIWAPVCPICVAVTCSEILSSIWNQPSLFEMRRCTRKSCRKTKKVLQSKILRIMYEKTDY